MLKKKTVLFLSLVVFSLITLTVDTKWRGTGKTPFAQLLPALAYLQEAVTKTWRLMRDSIHGAFSSRQLVSQNRELREEIGTLRERISGLGELEYENEKLRKLLDFREKSQLADILADSVGAEVIGRNPSNWYSSLTIDRGRADGLERDMAVVTAEGLVGRIRDVASTTSQVMLILDNENSVSATIHRTKEHGIVQGQLSYTLTMKYLPAKTDALPGDTVRSSGLGGIYPKDFLIGIVKDVVSSDYGLTKTARIFPAVDFSKIENVLVLKRRTNTKNN